MKPLETAFKQQLEEQNKLPSRVRKNKYKNGINKWVFDPDCIDHSPAQMTAILDEVIENCLKNKKQNAKYLQEQTYVQLINQLTSSLKHLPSQIQRLLKIQQVLVQNAGRYFGQQKNMIKHFQSILDAKIRKIKKRGRRSELTQFEKIVKKEKFSKNNKKICYIDEDDHIKSRIQNAQKYFNNIHDMSKPSFGTLNSGGSNQNDSGSNKNQSGSKNKSNQGNALAVLLANFQKPTDKKNQKDKQKQKYDFSSVLNASSTIRQRRNTSKLHETNNSHINQKQEQGLSDDEMQCEDKEDKDEAFIFHRPKYNNKHKF